MPNTHKFIIGKLYKVDSGQFRFIEYVFDSMPMFINISDKYLLYLGLQDFEDGYGKIGYKFMVDDKIGYIPYRELYIKYINEIK